MSVDGARNTIRIILIERAPDIYSNPTFGESGIVFGTLSRLGSAFRFNTLSRICPDISEENSSESPSLPHEYARGKTVITSGGIGIKFELFKKIRYGRSMLFWPAGHIIDVLLTSPTKTPFMIAPSVEVVSNIIQPMLFRAVHHRYVLPCSYSPSGAFTAKTLSHYIDPFYGFEPIMPGI